MFGSENEMILFVLVHYIFYVDSKLNFCEKFFVEATNIFLHEYFSDYNEVKGDITHCYLIL